MNSLNNARSNIFYKNSNLVRVIQAKSKVYQERKIPELQTSFVAGGQKGGKRFSTPDTKRENMFCQRHRRLHKYQASQRASYSYSFKIFLLLICLQNVLQTNLVKILQNLCNFKFAGSQEKLVKHKFVSWCSH